MKCVSLVIVECGAYGNSVCIMQKKGTELLRFLFCVTPEGVEPSTQ